MADALISVVVQQLAPFLLDKLKKEVKLVLGAPEDVQELHDTFDKISDVLDDAEKRHIQDVLSNMEKGEIKKAPASIWLEKLKDVSYQMEEVLDEWHTKLMKLEVVAAGKGKKKVDAAGKSKWKAWACFTSPRASVKKGTLHYKIGSRILELKKRLDLLMTEKDEYKFKEIRNGEGKQVSLEEGHRDTSSIIELSKVCGRDQEKTNLINMLLSKSSNAETNIPVISIIGMGGIGKTTLAKCIFNDEMVKNHFQMKMWICVSDPFDLTKIVKAIIEEAGDTVSNGTNTWNSLSRQLRKAVEGKLFLLVLDDVWTKDPANWEELKLALDFGKNGSIVVVTTRDIAVADAVGTNANDKHDVKRLSDEDCWSLFKRLAFKEVKEYDCRRLQEIGRGISDKCKGVPLLAKTLGSLMPSLKTTEDWEEVLTSNIWDLPLVNKSVLAPLVLSYNALPSYLKRCFTYCAVYPKDTVIKKDNLIKLWMAEGCLGSSQEKKLEGIGEKYFDELVMRSFFQELRLDEYDDVSSCKMHDLLHDLATFLGNNEYQVAESKGIKLDNTKLRHLCVQSSDEEMDGSLNSIWTLKSLRTLLVKRRYFDSSLEDWAEMSNLTCLRTLVLARARITKLPKEVENLIHLRYLNLSNCIKIMELPETITNLVNLQSLDLNNCCFLGGLPNSFGKLIHLRYLNLSETGIKELPETITNLVNLQTLNLKRCNSLGGLPNSFGKLVSLRHLNLSGCKKIKELPETITNLVNLQTLNLRRCESLGGLPNSFGKLVSLRHLDISGCYFSKGLPGGIGKLRELRTLSDFIGSEEGCDLGELKDLSNLCGSLVISNIRGIGDEALGVMNSKRYLQKLELRFRSESEDNDDLKALELLEPHSDLKELVISDYSGSKFPSWMEFQGTREKPIMLCRLTIENCSKLKVLPALAELQFLEHLKLHNLDSVAPMGVEVVGDKMSASNIAFPKLKELDIWNMNKWEEWVTDTRSTNMTLMPCLRTLRFEECRMLKSLPWQLLSSSSLRELWINDCPNLVVSSLPPFLEELNLVGDAGSLSKSLPVEGGLHMNLKHLAIKYSKQLTLPEGVAQLTGLQTLKITGSPTLAGRCKKGEGEEWNMISHIPKIIIEEEIIMR